MASVTIPPDYAAPVAADAIGFGDLDEALRFIAKPIAESQRLFIRSAVGQVLAASVLAPEDATELRLARVSGYALRSTDVVQQSSCSLRIAGVATPTNPYLDALETNECVQLAAGALLPARVDTLLSEDKVTRSGDSIFVRSPLPSHGQLWMSTHAFAMPQGVVFAAGHRLANTDLAVLASLGIYEVRICRPLRVGYLIVDDPQVHVTDADSTIESHRINLYSTLARLNVEIIDLDTVDSASPEMIASLTDVCDVLIIIGATDTEISRIGSKQYRVQIHDQPPIYAHYARINKTVFVGLPELPIQAMVALHHVVIPLVRYLRGERHTLPFTYKLQRPV